MYCWLGAWRSGWAWSGVLESPAFFRPPVSHGRVSFALERLVLWVPWTQTQLESGLWRVSLGRCSQAVDREGSEGYITGQREVLAWGTVTEESISQGAEDLG